MLRRLVDFDQVASVWWLASTMNNNKTCLVGLACCINCAGCLSRTPIVFYGTKGDKSLCCPYMIQRKQLILDAPETTYEFLRHGMIVWVYPHNYNSQNTNVIDRAT